MDRQRRPRVSLDLLRGFRAAARHLSFTRAAQELFLTQPAISREIRTLEEQLGQPLFHRVNRTLQLTAVGRELYRATEDAFAQLDAAIERIAGSGRSVAVTTTSAFASFWLAPRLPRFNRLHPGIDVRIVASNNKPDLERDQIDIAVRVVVGKSDAHNSEALFECKTFPACSPALARDKARPIATLADLAKHVRLDYESLRDGRRMSEWDFWFQATKSRQVKPASTLWFPQYDQLVAAAIAGTGVAIGVWPYLATHLRDGLLCAPFGNEGLADRGTFFLDCRPDVAGREDVQAFIAWLWDEARRQGEFELQPRARKGDRHRLNKSFPRRRGPNFS
jgi:LysR family transcriptional regulator, glycine cleavage system transcriptional activator